MALSFYEDLLNYDTVNCIYTYSVIANAETGLDFIHKNVTFDQGVFKTIYQIGGTQSINVIVPDKNTKIVESHKPGTPFQGYVSIHLNSYSKDYVMVRTASLALIDNQVYSSNGTNSNGTIRGAKLSPDLNDYLLNTIFTKL